ncbi:MAG TPA: hypothetical protein VGL57_07440 [Solirubrobacteraceae bacterium]|jgi:hypothetical protein
MALLAVAIVVCGIGCASASAAWTVKSTTPPTGSKESKLEGISCINGELCWAVGDYHTTAGVQEPLADSVYGGLAYPPTPGKEPILTSDSCPHENAEEFCMAVGRFINGGGEREAFAEKHTRTNGWELQKLKFPAGNTASELGMVSCPTTTECTAVGDYHDSTGEHYLAEQWSSTGGWSAEAPAAPTGAGYPAMLGLSCPKAKECKTIGIYRTSPYTPNLQVGEPDNWNGTTWTRSGTTMSDPGTEPFMTGLSCITMSECVGVGYYTGTNIEMMAQEWNGTRWEPWTITQTGTNELYGVSCWTSYAKCVAVGRHVAAGVPTAIGEELASNSWSAITLPSISGATASTLDRVSCVETIVLCYAVGSYVSGGKNVLLVERSF